MKKTSDNSVLGLRTAIYNVPDLAKARDWYRKALAIEPYFDQPFYVGFNVGGYELGLHPGKAGPAKEDVGAVVYWGVKDVESNAKRLIKLGAKKQKAVLDVGDGIRVATVVDPFGNVFGLIENPHIKLPSK
jgi:predicted enzyme related to lactoylglutathione lyase